MMAGGGGAAVDHNGIFSNPNLHSLQQPLMEADNADSRKRPLETPVEEAGCTKRTNIGGKRCTPRSSSATVSHLHEVKSVYVEAFARRCGRITAKHCLQCHHSACKERTYSVEADLGSNTQHLCSCTLKQ